MNKYHRQRLELDFFHMLSSLIMHGNHLQQLLHVPLPHMADKDIDRSRVVLQFVQETASAELMPDHLLTLRVSEGLKEAVRE